MPIDLTKVDAWIKTVEESRLERWKKDYFDKVARMLQVHTKGQLFTKVDTLFPNEHPESKKHCLATYEPITKSSIWKGINNLLRIFSSSSFSINVGEELTKYLEDYETNGHNLLHHFLEMWVHKAIAEDPNGIFAIYPPIYAEEKNECPVQYVRSELLHSCGKFDDGTEYVAFISERESDVKYFYDNVVVRRDVFEDPSVGTLNAKERIELTYNQRLCVKVVKAVYHVLTKEGFIVFTRLADGKYTWEVYHYPEPLSILPFFAAGGPVADEADHALYESFVQAFVPFGNLALLQHRNHRAVDLQFSYPRMSEMQMPCDHAGCSHGRVRCPKTTQFPDGTMPCPRCGTSKTPGWVVIQSPYKVYHPRYDPDDANDNKHLNSPPVEFFSPDVGIINYSKEAWRDYLKMAEEAIFVQQKVYTGQVQSKESKEIDLDELYAWLLNIAKMFYSNLRHMLQVFEEFVDPSPSSVTVERPSSFAILTETEAFAVLDKILLSAAPILVKANEVDSFVNKFVSKGSPVKRALRILKQYDPLLFYSDAQVAQFKATNVVNGPMVVKHVLAYPLMIRLYEQDKTIFDSSDDQIMALLDKEIATFQLDGNAPVNTNLRTTLLNNFNQPAA